MKKLLMVLAFVLLAVGAFAQTSGVTCEYWMGKTLSNPSDLVNNPNLLGTPTSTSVLTSGFVGPTNKTGGPFVARCTAKLVVPNTVPTTRESSFWIAANKTASLWFSSTPTFSGNPICKVSASFPTPLAQQWTRNGEMKSSLISLTAGGTYYLQVVHVAAVGSTNHLSVGWGWRTSAPGVLPEVWVYERPIPATRLQKPPTVSAPTVRLSTDLTAIVQGQAPKLTWSSTNATSCVASANPAYEYWTGTKAISGSQYVTPLVSEVPSLTCSGSGGSATASVSISVSPAETLNPRFVEFDPSSNHSEINAGGQAVVSGYELQFYLVGAVAPIQTLPLGKPKLDADGKVRLDYTTIPGVLFSWPISVAQYQAKVAAFGPEGIALSDWSNTFTIAR